MVKTRPLLSFLFLAATQIEIGKAVTDNGDGTGGAAPSIVQYVMLNADETSAYTAFDPHATHGVVLKDGGYVLVGQGLTSETGTGKASAIVTRIDLCSDLSKYDSALGVNLSGPGTNCANQFTWSWKEPVTTKHASVVWVAESPDGSYILAVGVKQMTNSKHQRYVVKLNAQTGALIWSFVMPTGSGFGFRSGYETIAFTQDGGFIVGGYGAATSTTFPHFKSGGTVDAAKPILQKFSAATASASTMASAPTPVWSYMCQATGTTCVTIGSSKAVRVYFDQGVEKVVTVPGGRASILVLDATTGAEVRFYQEVAL